MPRQDRPSGYEDMLTQSVADSIMSTADQIASESAGPPNTKAPSERQKVQLWGRTDPKVEYDQFLATLMASGIPREQMGTLQIARFYSKSHPDLIMAYGQPVPDGATADRLTKLAEYPFRLALYDHLDPKQRVTECERINREWLKTQPQAAASNDAMAAPADAAPMMSQPTQDQAPAPPMADPDANRTQLPQPGAPPMAPAPSPMTVGG